MDFMTAMDISASGLSAQRTLMNTVSMNLSNINTTRTADGGPYRRKIPVFTASPVGETFGGRLRAGAAGVKVTEITEDQSAFKQIYDPSHPDADQFGYVLLPNVNIMQEMVQMLSAKRSYEANVTALTAIKNMAVKALDILK